MRPGGKVLLTRSTRRPTLTWFSLQWILARFHCLDPAVGVDWCGCMGLAGDSAQPNLLENTRVYALPGKGAFSVCESHGVPFWCVCAGFPLCDWTLTVGQSLA